MVANPRTMDTGLSDNGFPVRCCTTPGMIMLVQDSEPGTD
jgi:hypothetical protein